MDVTRLRELTKDLAQTRFFIGVIEDSNLLPGLKKGLINASAQRCGHSLVEITRLMDNGGQDGDEQIIVRF